MRIPTTAPCLTARCANECTVASTKPPLGNRALWLSILRCDTAPVASCCCYSPQTSRQNLRFCIGGLCAPPTEYDRCRDSAVGRTGSLRTIPASLACCIVHRAGCRLQRRCCSVALFVPHCRAGAAVMHAARLPARLPPCQCPQYADLPMQPHRWAHSIAAIDGVSPPVGRRSARRLRMPSRCWRTGRAASQPRPS